MAKLTIEFTAGHQWLVCEACGFGSIRTMNRYCMGCGEQFTSARYYRQDGTFVECEATTGSGGQGCTTESETEPC